MSFAGAGAAGLSGTTVAELGSGHGVGEIALLRDVPRTASVRAVTEVSALALDRAAFLAVVAGHPGSRLAAVTVVADRLPDRSAQGA